MRGITGKLLAVIVAAFIASGAGVMLLAEHYLTRIVDQSQRSVYGERLEAITAMLERDNQRLEKTGMVEAYIDDFKAAALEEIRQAYYRGPDSVRPFILDANGSVLLHPARSPGDPGLANPGMAKGISRKQSGDFVYTCKSGERWCIFKRFPAWGWVVGYSMPIAVKYADVNEFRRHLAAIELAVSLAALFLLALLVKHFTRPIVRLTGAARAMASGDLDQEIAVGGADEVGVLANSFREMRDAIRRIISELRKENSDRRRAEEELRRQNDYMHSIIESVTHPLYVIDAGDYTVRMANSASGIRPGERRPCYAAIKGLERPCRETGISCPLDIIRETGKPAMIEHTHKGKDGRTRHMEVFAYPVFGPDGELDQMIEYAIDVTDRRRAQEELAAEKERLAVTLRSIGDGVITTDTGGRIMLMNRVAEKLTGWQANEAVGRPLAEVFNIVDERTGEPCESPVDKVMKDGRIVGLANHTALIARDGSKRSIADSGAPIMDAASRIIGVVLVFRDVTEQLRTERELLKMSKLESIGVLAGGIAHDFNNILAAILGNLNLVLFDKKLGRESRELIRQAEKASLRARDLTRQLLTFAKGGAPVKETSSLREVIRDSAAFVLHGGAVSCRFDIPDDLWLVDIDRGQIGQVIQNIVLNASHAMPGGGEVRISCRNLDSITAVVPFAASGPHVEIRIADNGIGMTADVVERIFDPYFTTKQEGSGLGLAICQSIISKHGGHITVESLAGQGSVFTIYLPRAREDAATARAAKPASGPRPEARRVLVVDDEDMVRRIVRAMLERLGHEVDTAGDGETALEMYEKAMKAGRRYDLVIMDLTIPGGMGGKEAIGKLLKLDPDARAIVSSGYSNDPVMAAYRDHGFAAAVIKPFQIEELRQAVEKALGA